LYESKLATAEEAISKLPSTGTLILHHAVMEPKTLVKELVRQRGHFHRLSVFHMFRNGGVDISEPGNEEYFLDSMIFSGANSRAALAEGRADYIPCFFYELPILIRNGTIPCDAALVQISPPDENGFCSLGASADYSVEAFRKAKTVVAQVNVNAPRTLGDTIVNISDIDYIVPVDEELYYVNPIDIGDEEKAIGANCASLVEDGATMQLGIGGIPDAVMLFLEGKKDLGIHSEMISDGTLALYEKGVINNSKKTIGKGMMTVNFMMGTKKLYDWSDGNPVLEMRTVDYVNHPVTIMQQYKPIGINACIEIDLLGQVVSDSIGLRQFSGTGGQVDFVRGCAMAEDGKSIIALPSSILKKDGTRISKIVPLLTTGAAVTTSRNDVDYIITENGIAKLKGKSLRERAKALIEIAHPDFRAELRNEYNKRFVD